MDSESLRFVHPFTCIVAGPTGSGKTVLVRNILEHHARTIDIPTLDQVYWFHGQTQSIYHEPIGSLNTEYIEDLPSPQQLSRLSGSIVVIDDLMNELGSSKFICNFFTKYSHHYNISVFLLVQNIFNKEPIMRTISLNTHNFLLLKNPRDKSQVRFLARQLYPQNPKILIEAYADATTQPHGYIRIDVTQKTPEQYRLSTRITEDSPIVYVPQKS